MNYLEINRRKILDKESLKSKLAYWKFKDYQVVFTNGCFDIVPDFTLSLLFTYDVDSLAQRCHTKNDIANNMQIVMSNLRR